MTPEDMQAEINKLGERARRAIGAETAADQALYAYRRLKTWPLRFDLALSYCDDDDDLDLEFARAELIPLMREALLQIAKRELNRMRRAVREPARKKKAVKA